MTPKIASRIPHISLMRDMFFQYSRAVQGESAYSKHFLFFIVGSTKYLGPQTARPILRRATWSLNAAAVARRPRTPLDGQWPGGQNSRAAKLAGAPLSKHFALTEIKGDWVAHMFIFGFKNFWRSGNICFRCNAARSATSGHDFTDWRHPFVQTSTSQLVLEGMPLQPSPLVLVTSFHIGLVWLSLQACSFVFSFQSCLLLSK